MDEKNESNEIPEEKSQSLKLIFQNYQDSSSESDSSHESDDESIVLDISSDDDDAISIASSKDAYKYPVKSKGELDLCDLPPIETLTISVEEEQCKPIGSIKSIVDTLVVVEAFINVPPLDIESVLFVDRGKRALGKIFEVVGPVNKPYYTIRFNDSEQIQKLDVQVKETVYCAPQTDYTSYVFISKIMDKGSDASWKDNNEPPPEYIDYSDDEKEKLAKKNKKNSKRSQNSKNTCKNDNDNQKPPDYSPQPLVRNQPIQHSQLQQHQSVQQRQYSQLQQHHPIQQPQHLQLHQHQQLQQNQPLPYQQLQPNQPTQPLHYQQLQHYQQPPQPNQPPQHYQQLQPNQPIQHYHSPQQESPYQPLYPQNSKYPPTTPIMPPRFSFEHPRNQHPSFPSHPQVFPQYNQPSYPQNVHNMPPGFNTQHQNYM